MAAEHLPARRSPSLLITLGISSCLLGDEVDYNGGPQKDSHITGVLGRHFASVSVCRDMEIGLIVPITLINHDLINHDVTRFEVAYVADQVYPRPHPEDLMLRNHI